MRETDFADVWQNFQLFAVHRQDRVTVGGCDILPRILNFSLFSFPCCAAIIRRATRLSRGKSA
jgi:hypothetical protein